MKKLLIVVPLSMIILLSSCNNEKYESLEFENKQLHKQIDSLTLVIQKDKEVIMVTKEMADESRREAIKSKNDAELQEVLYFESQKQLKDIKDEISIK